MRVTYCKKIVNFILIIVLFFSSFLFVNADIYSAGNDFSVNVSSLNNHVFNNNMSSVFKFQIINNKNFPQLISIKTLNVSGWDIILDTDKFTLEPNQVKQINIKFVPNSNFDYSTDVISSDTIKISQNSDYSGEFKFPIIIGSNDRNISLYYQLNIDKLKLSPEYNIEISTEKLSPIKPLKYTITSRNLIFPELVEINTYFNGKLLFSQKREFSRENYFQIITNEIPLNLDPGVYNVQVVVRFSENNQTTKEWSKSTRVEVEKYKNLKVVPNKFESYFKDVYSFDIENLGNTKSTFEKKINLTFLKSFFFGTNIDYKKEANTIILSKTLNRGEKFRINYYYNYLPIYIILLIVFLIVIRYYFKKNSNPLKVENKLYDIKKIEHEGVKSFKVRLGFENIKLDEIDELKLIFRMPSYLSIKEGSFLLSEPNHVLKGKSQFKLIWVLKRFEKEDSRIIGFTLENNKGILGDIKLPDLEFELKINGKIRKYYIPFDTIRN